MAIRSPKIIFTLGTLLGGALTWIGQIAWPYVQRRFYQFYMAFSDPHDLGVPFQDPQLICLSRNGYMIAFDPRYCAARWTLHKLSRFSINAKLFEGRSSFIIDRDLPVNCQIPAQFYEGQPWDRGHLVPCEDINYSDSSSQQTFLMSNVVPQNAQFNRSAWRSLEHQLRRWAYAVGNLHIVTGVCFKRNPRRLKDKIAIPDFFYKVVYCETQNQAIAFLYPNQALSATDLWNDDYVMSIQSLETHLYNQEGVSYRFFSLIEPSKRSSLVQEYDLEFWLNL